MHSGHRQRMKKRYQNSGIASFEDHEIIEVLLGYSIPRCDVNELAHNLVKKFGSINNVFSANYLDLLQVDGIGESSAILLSLIGDLHKLLSIKSMGERPILNNPTLASEYAVKLLSGEKTEFLYALLLDNQQRLIKTELLSEGTHNQITIDPGVIIRCAILNSAAFVILCHNHPGGSLLPSSDDLIFTTQVQKGLNFVGIVFAEHIIVADSSAYGIMVERECYSMPSPPIENSVASNTIQESNTPSDSEMFAKAITSLSEAQTAALIAMLDNMDFDE